MSVFGRAHLILCALVWTVLLVGGAQSASFDNCVLKFVEEEAAGFPSLGITKPMAEKLTTDAAQSIGLTGLGGIRVIPCSDGSVQQAQAYYSAGGKNIDGSDGIPQGDYILYDPTWLKQVVGDSEVEATFILGHELGHLIGRHFTSQKGLPRVKKELEADSAGACAVAHMKGSWTEMVELLKRLRDAESNGFYPSFDESLAVVQAGFLKCGGAITPDLPAPGKDGLDLAGVTVVYFEKASDGGAVLRFLNDNHVPYTTRQSETDLATNVMTCTPDLPVETIKAAASALINNGISLKSIHRVRLDPLPKSRISIETNDDIQAWPDLTLDEVAALTNCPEFGTLRPTPETRAVRVINKCPLGPAAVLVRVLDDATGRWLRVAVNDIGYNKTVSLKDTKGNVIFTSYEYLFYFGSATDGNRQFNFEDINGNNLYEIADNGGMGYYIKTLNNNITLTCDGME